jgi:hypothetical protein
MISGVATTRLPAVPGCDLRQTKLDDRPILCLSRACLLLKRCCRSTRWLAQDVASKITMTRDNAAHFFKQT